MGILTNLDEIHPKLFEVFIIRKLNSPILPIVQTQGCAASEICGMNGRQKGLSCYWL